MIKRISLVRRKQSLTREAFVTHWMGPHADIIRRLPGLLGLRFGVVQQWSPKGADWDGVGELWFHSIAFAEHAIAAEPYRSLMAEDRKKFVEEGEWCFVEEHAAVSPPFSRPCS